MPNNNLISTAKGIKTRGIVSLVLIFTIIGILVSGIMTLIDGIKILTTKWNNKELEEQKTLWGLLTLLVLGPIGSIVFGSKAVNELNNSSLPPMNPYNDPTMNNPFIDPNQQF